jgi:chaperone modulatory protein CbpM
MSNTNITVVHGVVVEDEVQFTLVELCRVCAADPEQVIALVDEGVLAPSGAEAHEWRFGGATLRRARAALRLTRDLELSAAGTALVLDLLDQIEALRTQVHRLGG